MTQHIHVRLSEEFVASNIEAILRSYASVAEFEDFVRGPHGATLEGVVIVSPTDRLALPASIRGRHLRMVGRSNG